MRSTKWDRTSILREIRKAHREGLDLSYNATARRNQALISACNYHYKGYKHAVEMAGFNYAQIIRKPWWTPPWVVRTIKQAKRAGEDLSWRVVSKRRDALGHCAIAAVRPRLFGSWDKALEAAGVDAGKVRRYQGWAVDRCLDVLRDRAGAGKPVNSGTIQRELPGLYGAVVRHFGRFDAALTKIGVDPTHVRQRRVWSRAEVVRELSLFHDTFGDVTTTLLRKHDYSLQKAAVAQFGSVDAAVRQLGKSANGATSRPGDGRLGEASKRVNSDPKRVSVDPKRVSVDVGPARRPTRTRPAKPGTVVNGKVDADGHIDWNRPAPRSRRPTRATSGAS